MTKTTLVLVLLMSVWKGVVVGTNGSAESVIVNAHVQSYAPFSANGGWLLMDHRLYVTHNNGTDWQDITPTPLTDAQTSAILFDDAQHGWVALAQEGYTLANTNDGGRTWAYTRLPAPGDDESFAPAAMQLSQTPDGDLWLYIRRATSSAFRVGVWWRSADGGASWRATSEPAQLSSNQSAIRNTNGLQGLATAGRGVAWAKQVDGACQADVCRATTRLFATHDGGATWHKLALPFAGGLADGALAEQAIFTGHGFDSCDAPSLNNLAVWRANGPYRAVNFYMGGAARGCANARLDAVYVSRAAAMGWSFIPTWVGPQAPCSVYSSRFSADPNTAREQGKTEASAAVARALELGLGSAITPTVIYYDLEAYPTSDAACRAAAAAFMDGWTQKMRQLKHIPGVYGAACGSALADFVALPHVPEAVWLAYWTRASFDAAMTVWDIPCLGNDVWSNHQRLRQYTNSHDETWGGVTLEVDSNALDGPVSGSVLAPPVLNRQLRFPTMFYKGK